MSYRNILEWPDPNLKKVSEDIDAADERTATLVQDLIDTLKVAGGAGLAAPQIGVPKRAVVLDVSKFNFENPEKDSDALEDKNMWVLLNPSLGDTEGSVKWEEGCLSVPWHALSVERSRILNLTYTNVDGEEKSMSLDMPMSLAVQHECDHLDGKLILDRVSRLVSQRTRKSIQKKRKKLELARKALLSSIEDPTVGKPKISRLGKKEIQKRKKRKRMNRGR